MWNEGRRLNSNEDFRKLYMFAARDSCAGMPAEKAEERMGRAIRSSSLAPFNFKAARIREIYGLMGYDAAFDAARVAAKFEDGNGNAVQISLLEILSYMAREQKEFFMPMLGQIEQGLLDIGRRGNDALDIRSMVLWKAKGLATLFMFLDDKFILSSVGDRDLLVDALESFLKSEIDPMARKSLNSLLNQLKGDASSRDLDEAKERVDGELGKPIEDILRDLRGEI